MTGMSRIRHRFGPIVLSVLAAATVVACSEQTGPTAAELAFDGRSDNGGRDSGQQAGDGYTIHGRVLRFSGEPSDSLPNDTLGTPEPVPGALVEAYFLAHLPPDTGDTIVPPDSGDTIRPPVDSSWVDSSRVDSLMARLAAGVRGSWIDTSSGGGGKPDVDKPVAWDRTNADGVYALRGVPNGLYRLDVTPSGSRSAFAWTWVVVRDSDVWMYPFLLPPSR